MNRYQVLLVDDEEMALWGMEQGIPWKDLAIEKIFKADSMKNARRILERQKIDLMISDIEMPGGSGLELIRWVRETYPDIICIFYTCHADFGFCQEAIRLGASDYVLKPIPYDELAEVIRKGLFRVQKGRDDKDLRNLWGELTASGENPSVVDQVKKMITENLSVEMSREELARRAFISPDYLTKLFKKETGMSLSEYIIQKRILLAQQLLSSTSMSIVEISQKAGFSYSSYFVRIFKKKVGMTPQQYREEHGKE